VGPLAGPRVSRTRSGARATNASPLAAGDACRLGRAALRSALPAWAKPAVPMHATATMAAPAMSRRRDEDRFVMAVASLLMRPALAVGRARPLFPSTATSYSFH